MPHPARKAFQHLGRLLFVALPVVSGCATTYVPARSPRIAIVSGGYFKDGKKLGLLEAVRGNPRAEAEARTYDNLVAGTVGLLLGGLATTTGGLILGVETKDRALDDLALGMLLAGFSSIIVSDVLITMAPPHAVDAINIYNDGVDQPRKTPLATTSPPSRDGPAPP
jgi:hypothetical protein